MAEAIGCNGLWRKEQGTWSPARLETVNGQLARSGQQTGLALARAANIHHPAELVQGEVVSLLALKTMQRQMVAAAVEGHVREFLRRLQRPDLAPGAITQIEHAVVV